MRRIYLALALSVALVAAGCIGSDAGGPEGLEEASGPEDASQDQDGPTPIERSHEGQATVGIPVYDPESSIGHKATLVWESYQNGLNGTWVLGYEVEVPDGYDTLTVESSPADARPVADYDLFIFDSSGQVADQSLTEGADEQATVDEASGTYLVALAYFTGAADSVATEITVT